MKESVIIILAMILLFMLPVIAEWIIANHYVSGLIIAIIVNIALWGKEITND